MSAEEEAVRRIEAEARERTGELDLGNLDLTAVPGQLADLAWLRKLHLNGNRLSTLPDWIGRLTVLEDLRLVHNDLVELPETLGGLQHLTRLHLGRNQWRRLPDWLGGLLRLENLHLEHTGLTELPPWLRTLRRLATLDIGANRLERLPDWLSEMSELSTLHLYRCSLTQLPEQLRGVPYLSTLYLNGNRLTDLPDWIGELTSLSKIYLYGNRIATLPDSMRELRNLTTLDLKRNRLQALPDSLRELRLLSTLDLDQNRLKTLPAWVADLPALTRLAVRDNPLPDLPREVQEAGTDVIRAFLHAVRGAAEVQWSSKVLVVGQARMGKTSIVRALRDLPFRIDRSPTHGVEVATLELQHPTQAGTTMQLAVWDFGGQLKYRATQRIYLTDRSMYVLAWDMEGDPVGQAQLEEWLATIESAAPGAPVLIVGTRCTGALAELDEPGLRERHPCVVDFAEVDCADGTGFDELRRRIANIAAGLPLMGQRWPAAWGAAARALSGGRPQPLISFQHAARLMENAGLTDPEQQRALLAVLHDRGEVLHFARHPDLRDRVILRPTWVADMATRLLDSSRIGGHGGRVSRADLDEQWPEASPGLRETLLALMERFHLAYRITDPDEEDVALVVERLYRKRPKDLEQLWDAARARPDVKELQVTYRLENRQPGIPSWFIAQEHRFSVGRAWANGVLLHQPADSFGTAEAWALLVDDGQSAPTIRLTVRGTEPIGFRQLLDQGFSTILAKQYPGLGYTKLVPCVCQEQEGAFCGYEFELSHVLRFLEMNKPIQCAQTAEMVDPRQVLLGLLPYRQEAELADFMSGVTEYVARADRRLLMLCNSMRDLLQDLRVDGADHHPGIFTLERKDRYSYELRLFCEDPGGPHPLPDELGLHTFRRPPDWLRPYIPHLRRLIAFLAAAVPLVAPVSTGVLDTKLSDATKARLELTKKLIDSLSGFREDTVDTELLSQRLRQPSRVEVDKFRRALSEITKGFQGLYAREIPEYPGTVFYLCEEHRRQLE